MVRRLPKSGVPRHPIAATLSRGRSLIRHPVSVTRHRIGTILLSIVALSFGLYFYFTRDESIRRRTVAYLTEVTGGEVKVGQANFSMFGGITLNDVRVSTPYDKELDPSAVDATSREIFSARTLMVQHDPWRLLMGSLRIDRIIAAKPIITLSQNIDTGKRNWRSLFSNTPRERKPGPSRRPLITLRNAQVDVVSIEASGKHTSKTTELDADVRPHPQNDQALCIEVRRFTEPAERTTVIFNPREQVVANTPFVDMGTIGLQLPAAYQRFFEQIQLAGELKLVRVNYGRDPEDRRDMEVEIRDVRCTFPPAMWRPKTAPALDPPGALPKDNLVMTEMNGRMTVRGDVLEFEMIGRLNGAPCRVDGRIDHIQDDAELRDYGLDLHLAFDRFIMPEGGNREDLLNDLRVPEDLREFICRYDPHGAFDIECYVVRPAFHGPGRSFRGVIRPQGGDGSFHKFPYRVTDLRGEILIESERILFNDVRGLHGSGTVRVNGAVYLIDFYDAFDLYFHTTGIPLDDALFDALPPKFRAITERFRPRGTANVLVHLYRESGPRHMPRPSFHATVTADLIDARASFDEFPYKLTDVYGRVRVADDRLELLGLRGQHGDATVVVDGYATVGPGPSDVELRIEGRDVALDADLAAALPDDVGTAFTKLRPSGKADVLARVYQHGGSRELTYDVEADLRDASIQSVDMPVRVTDLSGRLRIRPRWLELKGVRGRRAEATVEASGDIRRAEPSGVTANMTVAVTGGTFDGELRTAMPEATRRVWALFEPGGRFNLNSQFHYASRDGESSLRHRTLLETTGATATYRGFPVPLHQVDARVLITDRRVELQQIRGKYGEAQVEVRGDVDLTEPGRRGSLNVVGKNLTWEPTLIAAFPNKLSAALSAIKPTGAFDISLDSLRFDIDEQDRTAWDYSGRIDLRDLTGRMGFAVKDAHGQITARGRIDRDGGMSIDAATQFAKATLGTWKLADVSGQFKMAPGSNTMQLEDGAASIYGGQADANAEFTFGPRDTTYKASITFRDAELARFIAENKPGGAAHDANASTARGNVVGNMFLRGRTGPRGYREGGGEMFIREAQVWKLPLAMAIFQVLNLTPDENVFHDGWLKFFLNEDTLTLQKIDLQGKAMSFVGGGRMDLNTGELDVTLLAGSPVRIRLPILTDLVEAASREIMEVRIRGTAANPRIIPQPLKSLSRALETIFPEPPESRERREAAVPGGSRRD